MLIFSPSLGNGPICLPKSLSGYCICLSFASFSNENMAKILKKPKRGTLTSFRQNNFKEQKTKITDIWKIQLCISPKQKMRLCKSFSFFHVCRLLATSMSTRWAGVGGIASNLWQPPQNIISFSFVPTWWYGNDGGPKSYWSEIYIWPWNTQFGPRFMSVQMSLVSITDALLKSWTFKEQE